MRDMSYNALRGGVPLIDDSVDRELQSYKRLLWAVLESIGGEAVVSMETWRSVCAQGVNPKITSEKFRRHDDPAFLAGIICRRVKKG